MQGRRFVESIRLTGFELRARRMGVGYELYGGGFKVLGLGFRLQDEASTGFLDVYDIRGWGVFNIKGESPV